MRILLRATRGLLKSSDGASAGTDVEIRKRRFLIGSSPDCHLCCPSSSISDRHCEVHVVSGNQIKVIDLGSESGTYVNGSPVVGEQSLQIHDLLRVGRLEFELVIDHKAPSGKKTSKRAEAKTPVAKTPAAKPAQTLEGAISDLLVRADEEERRQRLGNVEALKFRLEPSDEAGTQDEVAEDGTSDQESTKPPQKLPPGKLPPVPKRASKDSISAAEEGLRRLFGMS